MAQQNPSFSAEKIAKLARLQFNNEELDKVQSQLSDVLAFVDQIEAVELDGVEPYFGQADCLGHVRDDGTKPSLPRDQGLGNAPDHDNEFYRVPPVFG